MKFKRISQFFIAAVIILSFIPCRPGICEEGISWDRYRLRPGISVLQAYTDNVFLASDNTEDDFITRIEADLAFDIAIKADNYISLIYKGIFDHYAEFDNFRKDQHKGGLNWSWLSPTGSKMDAGVHGFDGSIQPYSIAGRAKDYIRWTGFYHLLYKASELYEGTLDYDYVDRQFDEAIDEGDNFKRHTISFGLLYRYYEQFPFLVEYRLSDNDNNDLTELSTDFMNHSIFFGSRWEPGTRLSGALRVGYFWSDFKDLENTDGLAIDTNLTYQFSDITDFQLRVFRNIQNVTRTARDTGAYYIATGAGFTVNYRYWEILPIDLFLSYRNNDYEGASREDDLFTARLQARYRFTKRFSMIMRYRYRNNDSNLEPVNYTENRISLGLNVTL